MLRRNCIHQCFVSLFNCQCLKKIVRSEFRSVVVTVPACCIVGYTRQGRLVRCILDIFSKSVRHPGMFWCTADFDFVCMLHACYILAKAVLLVLRKDLIKVRTPVWVYQRALNKCCILNDLHWEVGGENMFSKLVTQ